MLSGSYFDYYVDCEGHEISHFYEQLESYARANSKEDREKISSNLWDRYGVEEAVFVLDLSGFSRTAEKHGIVHYLSMIQRMRMTLKPLIDHYRGSVVKFEADNCFARFLNVRDAIRTGVSYNLTLTAMNLTTPDDLDIHSAIGIDYGKFLLVNEFDMYGEPVNIASKLGEDTAKAGQILVTQNAIATLGDNGGFNSKSVEVIVSGMNIKTVEIEY